VRRWVRRQARDASGNTLVELLVVLAVLGVLAGVTGLAFRRMPDRRLLESAEARIAAARRQAIEGGRSVTVTVIRDGNAFVATASADGSVVTDTSFGVDRLSGRVAR
jgi:prepilin-type N-terminal cleavage/methylation domain-containing protein